MPPISDTKANDWRVRFGPIVLKKSGVIART